MNLLFENGQVIPFKPVNYFDMFGLSQAFSLDTIALEKNYLDIQKQIHPDKFSTHATSQQMQALQWGAFVNDAYDVLKNDVKRAAYLLEILGEADVLQNHKLPPNMMTQQFMWREQLAEGDDLENLKEEIKTHEAETLTQLKNAFETKDVSKAKDATITLQFVTKFKKELKRKHR